MSNEKLLANCVDSVGRGLAPADDKLVNGTEYPKRKHIRLKKYDYSQNGYYYITICSDEKKCIFGSVGQGLGPAAAGMQDIRLSPFGKIAEEQLFALETRYSFVKVDKYIIMLNHLHFVLSLDGETAGASPALRCRI